MERAAPVPPSPEKIEAMVALCDGDRDAAMEQLSAAEMWKNDRYTVVVDRRPDGSVHSLSIRRNDRKPIHDWRHLQRIKNELAGDEIEAVELYPAMSRLMDTANHYWLWCAPEGASLTVGFETGAVSDDDPGVGSVQRPLPNDWKEKAR